MQGRIKFLFVIFILVFILILIRLFYWQVFRNKDLSIQARRQYQINKETLASRGNILANDGSILAGKADSFLVFATIPDIKQEPKKIANLLAPFFVPDANDKPTLLAEVSRLEELLQKKEVVWIPLKQKVDSEVKKNIEAVKIEGIGFEKGETRFYPEASSAAHLLGFVGKNSEGQDQGYFGLEGYYDLVLSGKPGFLTRESDIKGDPILLGDSQEVGAVKGVDLETFIEKGIELAIDTKLKEGIEKYSAKGGTVVVMDPKTGGILGLSSYPNYDPKAYYNFGNEYFKDPAIAESFEPGSVFKILVMASALDAEVIKKESICDICDKAYKVDKYLIETWDKKYFPDSSMTDIIVHSDNVGMVYVAQKLGVEKMYDYLDKFGIGKLTGIDLQGESSPKLREKDIWNIVDLSTAGFGQGVALTPIQMIRASSAIANKGLMVTPRVVNKLRRDLWQGKVDLKVTTTRVISEKTAREVTEMMVEAAKSGESKWTYLKGFKVAGKTGTAQIPISGHYDEKKTIASFIGFAPADNPKFIMLVTLKEPQSSQWASETAAPLWYNIAKDLFLYFGIQPES